jgi:hypothetical protein
MPSIITNIARIEPGGESLISAKKANELIDAINAMRAAVLFPNTNVGSFLVTNSQFILNLSQFDQRLQAVESSASSSSNSITSIQNNITIIENRLNNPNITASGTCTGNNITINISLNI